MKQQIHFCNTRDNVRIAYAVSGSGPPLVRVANWLTHVNDDWKSPVWSHWFQELSQSNRLIRYDSRGTGLSDRQVGDISVNQWRIDLEAVVDDLGLERFALLGFCQGGATAVAYAARHPDRVSHLVLYDSYVRGAYAEGAGAEERRKADALAELIEVGWEGESPAFRQVFANLLIPDSSGAQQRWLSELQRQSVSSTMAVYLWKAFHNIDIWDLARQITVPTLALHVQGDQMVPFEQGRLLASLIPSAQFVPLPGRNHILLEDDPAWPRFVEETLSFLGSSVPGMHLTSRPGMFARLTPREYEVLELIASGLTNSEISSRLTLAPKTVRNYTSRIYTKLQVNSRAQAIVLAREAGLGWASS